MAAKEPTYSDAQIEAKLKDFPGWWYEDGWIRRNYKTDGWPTTLMLVNAIGYVAEAAYHHPDLSVTWGRVIVKLQNHATVIRKTATSHANAGAIPATTRRSAGSASFPVTNRTRRGVRGAAVTVDRPRARTCSVSLRVRRPWGATAPSLRSSSPARSPCR